MSQKEKLEQKTVDSFILVIRRFFILMDLERSEANNKALQSLLQANPELPDLIKYHAPEDFKKLQATVLAEEAFVKKEFHKKSVGKIKKISVEQIFAIKKYTSDYVKKYELRKKIFQPILEKDTQKFMTVLRETPALVEERYKNSTVLGCAIENHQVEMVQFLVKFLNKRQLNENLNGKHALHLAIEEPGTDILKILKTEPNLSFKEKGEDGWTPLHRAASLGREEHTRLLLEEMKDEEIDEVDKYGNTALDLAIIQKNNEVAKILLEQMKSRMSQERITWAFKKSLQYGNLEIAKSLLIIMDENGIEADENPYTVFMNGKDYPKIIDALFENKNIRDNIKNKCPGYLLYMAVSDGNINFVKTLLKKLEREEVVSELRQQSILRLAILKGQKEIVQILLKDERILESIKSDNFNPLYVGIYYNQDEIFDILLSTLNKEQINTHGGMNSSLPTPLILAIQLHRYDVAGKLLASKKVEINPSKLYSGQTVLEHVVGTGDPKLLKLLLNKVPALDFKPDDVEDAIKCANRLEPRRPEIIVELKKIREYLSQKEEVVSERKNYYYSTDSTLTNSESDSLDSNSSLLDEQEECSDRDAISESSEGSLSDKEEKKGFASTSSLVAGGSSGGILNALSSTSPTQNREFQKALKRNGFSSKPIQNLEKTMEAKSRYIATSFANSPLAHFTPKKEPARTNTDHYFYVAESFTEKNGEGPLYVCVTKEVADKYKNSWPKVEKHLLQSLKFIDSDDQNRSGIKKFRRKRSKKNKGNREPFYEICIKDKEVGNERIYTKNDQIKKQYVESLGQTVNVMRFDGYASSHNKTQEKFLNFSAYFAAQ